MQQKCCAEKVEREKDMANLTSKELTALEDQLSYEQTLVKKYRSLADECCDTKLKMDFQRFADKHQQHFNTLISFLK